MVRIPVSSSDATASSLHSYCSRKSSPLTAHYIGREGIGGNARRKNFTGLFARCLAPFFARQMGNWCYQLLCPRPLLAPAPQPLSGRVSERASHRCLFGCTHAIHLGLRNFRPPHSPWNRSHGVARPRCHRERSATQRDPSARPAIVPWPNLHRKRTIGVSWTIGWPRYR